MQRVFAAACARNERARAVVLFAVALRNTLAAVRSDADGSLLFAAYTPWRKDWPG